MRINHNLPALEALTRLAATNGMIGKSLEKLSSGLKIVRASDDAAGLAVSEKMRAQINALNQAKLNAEDGISLLQTAEGALSVTHNILQRLNTLSVRAANDATLTTEDKQLMQSEVTQLTGELTRMASTIKFNTKQLLTGAFTSQSMQVGAESETSNQITFDVTGVSSDTLGLSGLDLVNSATAAITAINSAITTVSQNRGQIGAVMNRLEKTIENLDIQIVNMTASESRVRDVDMAAEMAAYTKLQVLQQSGVAMLAQANAQPQSVLKLLS